MRTPRWSTALSKEVNHRSSWVTSNMENLLHSLRKRRADFHTHKMKLRSHCQNLFLPPPIGLAGVAGAIDLHQPLELRQIDVHTELAYRVLLLVEDATAAELLEDTVVVVIERTQPTVPP